MSSITRGMIFGGQAAVSVLDTKKIVREARERHALTERGTRTLGNALTAAAYLCSWLKDGVGSLSVLFKGAEGMAAVAGDGALRLRGYYREERGGELTVIRDDGERIPFSGTVFSEGGVQEAVEKYFSESEQRTVLTRLFSNGNGAGGVFVELLPDAHAGTAARAKSILSQVDFYDFSSERVLRQFQAENAVKREIFFRCHCSFERAEAAVIALGREEAEALIEERGEIRVHCDYCNSDYVIDGARLKELF